jgi:hypothetical protein
MSDFLLRGLIFVFCVLLLILPMIVEKRAFKHRRR